MASQAKFVKEGYGQVEPNHLSAQRTGQIYAQLPVNKDIAILENGQFVKYDYANSEVNFTGKGEWMLVYNEVKVYRDRETDKDFAMMKDNYNAIIYDAAGHPMPADTTMVPRVFKTNIGDIFTTNLVNAQSVEDKDIGTVLCPNEKGILTTPKTVEANEMQWQIVKVITTPDGQPAVKVMRIA